MQETNDINFPFFSVNKENIKVFDIGIIIPSADIIGHKCGKCDQWSEENEKTYYTFYNNDINFGEEIFRCPYCNGIQITFYRDGKRLFIEK